MKNNTRVLTKLLKEHEKAETPAQEAKESEKTQKLEKKLGVEVRKGAKKAKKV